MPFTRFPRVNRALFLISIVCLLTTLVATVFVAARSGGGEEHLLQTPQSAPLDRSTKTKIAEQLGRLPLSFEVNEGQLDRSVKFLSRGSGYELFLTNTEAVLLLRKQSKDSQVREGTVLRLKMLGANTDAQVAGQDELPGKINYFTGNDPEKWRRNVSTYQKVYYKDLYPGIDVVYYGNQRELEYDFVIAPNANPNAIKFRVEGAERIRVDDSGSLLLALKEGEVRLNKPFIYQVSENGSRNEIKGAYAIKGNEISFKVRGFDSRKQLVIDPVLSYSTFLGSSGNDVALGIAVDSQGSAYVTGSTDSTAFPTTAGAFKTTVTFGSAFVTKLDPTGSSLVYSTYLSGSGATQGSAIAVDASGNAHVTGVTSADDFPVVNALKKTGNFFTTADSASSWSNNNTGISGDVRSIAVAPNGLQILYAGTSTGPHRSNDGGATWTKLPTTGLPVFQTAISLGVSPVNSAVVYAGMSNGGLFRSLDGGNTWTTVSLPVPGLTVFTIVFDPATSSTMYVGTGNGIFKSADSGSTWTPLNNFGLGFPPNVRAIAIDPTTPSTIYTGTFGNGLFKTTNGGANWSPINNGLTGNENNFVNALAIDPFNAATIYSAHGSSGGPGIINKTTNGGGLWAPINNGVPPDAVVTAIVADRTTPATLYASTAGRGIVKTINGGTSWTSANNGLWNAHVVTLVAHAANSTIMFAGAIGLGPNSEDAFITKLNSSGSGVLFSTYLGGSFGDIGNGIAVDAAGNIYVVGETRSINFPAVNAIQSAPSATENCSTGFVTKINPSIPAYAFSTYLGGSRCDIAHAVAIDSAGSVYVTGKTHSSDFPVANAFQPTIAETFSGDAFVTKLTTNGSLAYSTFLGGNGTDIGRAIAVDVSGNAYIAGSTTSANFPTLNPLHGFNGGFAEDAFVTKLNSTGSSLVYSTYLGGESSDFARGIAVDSTGSAYVVGFTNSTGFPIVPGALRTRSAMFKTLDGGATWSNDNYGFNLGVNSEVTSLAVHPVQTSTIYAGTLSGVFRSTNGGRTWSSINNGLNDVRVFQLLIDPSTPSTIYVATRNFGIAENGVYKSTDGGNTWNLRKNGMGSSNVISLAIDPVSPNTLYAGSNSGGLGGKLFKTTDGGDNWVQVGNPPPTSFESIAVDPHNHTTLYGAEPSINGGLYKSVDAGDTWNPIGFDQTGAFGTFVAVSPHTPNLVYARLNGLFKSVDGGDNWSKIADTGGKVFFDPVSPSTIYSVSILGGILRSTDNGATFVPIDKGLNGIVEEVLAIDPVNTSTLYAGTNPLGGDDAFVAKLSPNGQALTYSTFLGGVIVSGQFFNANAQGFAIALDSGGNAYVTGLVLSSTFPTTANSFQPLIRGMADTFISKLTMSHIISGHVLDGSNAPVSGVEVVLNNGTSLTQVLTEGDGSYEFSHLREGGTYTVTASKAHFTMTPPSQTFNNLNSDQTLNFTAIATNAAFHTISGQIGIGLNVLRGVTVTLSGSQSGLRTTDALGNYSFELPAGGNYTVTPSILGFTFGPINQTFNNLSAPQVANFAATRQNFVVTNANNHGTGSLREAINNANATFGTDTIVFNIPGPGIKTLNLMNALPDITDPVVIDATTQPGYTGSPLIEINGQGISNEKGLFIKAGGTTVRGLAIGNFSSGAGIFVQSCDNNVFQGNYLGVDAAGNTARPNSTGLLLAHSSNNLIGGTTAAARNVISGNSLYGINMIGGNNVTQGNYIGTNATGTAAIGNGNTGVSMSDLSYTNNLIGGTTPGAGNLISGNQMGVVTNTPGAIVQGNLIGTDVTGTKKLPNNGPGVWTSGTNTQIGGLTLAARNIISGNSGNGVFSSGAGNKVQGNFIGTDITGTLPLGNGATGVVAGAGTLIGGTTPEARNIISANGSFGNVALGENSSGSAAIVQGNYIGTDVTGTKALAPSNTMIGITIFSNNHVIGGAVPGAGNVISGNGVGIQVGGFSSNVSSGNVIQGNLIGLNAQGTAPLPNSQHGVQFTSADNNILGGTQTGAANKIAFNGVDGVFVASGTGNSIRGNSIFSNTLLGIHLRFTTGTSLNDPGDGDTGPNNQQNFPIITTVLSSGSSTTIQGSLNSTPNTTFNVDFYSNASVDPVGGEGALYFGTASLTTAGSGNVAFTVVIPKALPAGRVITATATDPNGNTSQFSPADASAATGTAQFNFTSFFVIEDVGMATLTVQRTGGSLGNLTVEYETTDGTATAGQDYTATSGTLTFANGETSKTIQVPILDDATTEPDETFTLSLKNAANIEAISAPASMVITIQDRTTVPALLSFNASVTEGNAGTTTDARFEVRLSAATGRTVSVNYATANFTAHGGAACGTQGVDYESTSGTITFQPGTFSISIPVKVCGDTSAETNETFALSLSGAANATIANSPGVGVILNDDVIELILEEMGPGVNQAAALDALLALRDPFRVESVRDLFANGTDRNTRVVLFVRNLQLNPGEASGSVSVRLIASNNQVFDVFAEDFRAVSNTDLMQVVFKLPSNLPAGTCTVIVRSHTRASNMGTIRIAP